MNKRSFELCSGHEPAGDQPEAIKALVDGLGDGLQYQTLLGVTGSGKTYTMANVIAATNRPALIMSPNKTLCAQLYSEMKAFFPNAAVEYFVSYFDYFQPEAYLPALDKYVDKDSLINQHLATLRMAATKSILTRNDTIIVSTVSAIYGLGEQYEFSGHVIPLKVHDRLAVDAMLRRLVESQYKPAGKGLMTPGTFRHVGDVVTVHPVEEEALAVTVSFFDDEIEKITMIDPITGQVVQVVSEYTVFPASHHVVGKGTMTTAMERIQHELNDRLKFYKKAGRTAEAARLRERVRFDLEMLAQTGWCNGIENYSRHLTNRAEGEPPPTLIDYLPRDAILFIDESHTSVPQTRGMSFGDRARKETLVEYGFRLPSAIDARPLTFDEFIARVPQTVFVSATPGEFELEVSGQVAELVVRPTGVVDPIIEVRPVPTQVDDVMAEVHERVRVGERVLITVLTKRMAEELAEFLHENGIRARYLHGDVEAVERVEIIRDLRLGRFDVLVGINLLREGLDLPEVSLVAVMDADKEGFLRNARSLIQTVGRAARNVNGHAIFYADKVTGSMMEAIDETARRRTKQLSHNVEHGITPKNVINSIRALLDQKEDLPTEPLDELDESMLSKSIRELEKEMKKLAKDLEFEKAARVRDRIFELKRRSIGHV